ncbi:hypothetical protein TVAG_046340 [Trichomonas vaginalis G3]|uniref:Bap-like n=1 Tax=Trichomonas vaginalis (strain ATCC PRA-98 / G3) TaxID=412133 RepID=A2DMK3_TRIV3|nr:hypothetical protein TVAGG3_0336250 [Trichomonas vaginalis G3]EAY18430.1 hypothetical protein TVAG_046340 [Trichomonas vaginalis G3]KAI5530291.1 hypothetical protein TVAGG3_0336250 [Trichomonas vaginalis G3]|eukprot:XP_001579416.1 hypothetical protein [Trichomonas vaginalis G3]
MFLSLFSRASYALEAWKTGKYSYKIYDLDEYDENLTLSKKIHTKIAFKDVDESNQGDVVDISEVDGLDYSFNIINDKDGKYIIVQQTLTNNRKERARFDLCTAIEFNFNEDGFSVTESYMPNFGFYLWVPGFGAYTWVQENHPWVTARHEKDFGEDSTPLYFTTRKNLDPNFDEAMTWMATSWTNNHMQPGDSVTFSYMIAKESYDPPFLKLDKTLIKKEYEDNEKIHLKGSMWTNLHDYRVQGKYEITNKQTKEVLTEEIIDFISDKNGAMSKDYDVEVGPLAIGEYTLRVTSYIFKLNDYLWEEVDFSVIKSNQKPKINIGDKGYTYYLPNSDVSFTAAISDADAGDKKIDVKVYLKNEMVIDKKVPNSLDQQKFTFKIPKNTEPGTYDVRITANDGKLTTDESFKIVVKLNSKLSIEIEIDKQESYKKGEKITFNAFITDSDTNFDSEFEIKVFYGDKLYTSTKKKNDNPQGIRVPFEITVPEDETQSPVRVRVQVTSLNENDESGFSFNVFDDAGNYDKITDHKNEKPKSKLEKQKTALIAVLCVLIVAVVCVSIFIVYLLVKK